MIITTYLYLDAAEKRHHLSNEDFPEATAGIESDLGCSREESQENWEASTSNSPSPSVPARKSRQLETLTASVINRKLSK